LPEFATLDAHVRRRLSQYEFINLVLCGLWLESIFIDRLGSALAGGLSAAERTYLLHEIREEAGHSLMFLKLIGASGLSLPERAWRRPRFIDTAGRWLPVTGPLFWLAAAVGEDISDKFNRYLRHDGGGQINPLIRQMCTLHIVDEARHVAYSREQIEIHLARAGTLRRRWLNLALNSLLRQFALRFYCPPAEFYELAGLRRGAWWRHAAHADPQRREFVRARMAPTARMLEHYGFRVRPL
jgi:para-aminobenzoate N-oxygenase AurF